MPEEEAAGQALTIAEAAAALGIQERRLRRILARVDPSSENAAPYMVRTLTESRATVTGTRSATVLPAALVEDIRATLLPRMGLPHPDLSSENADTNDDRNPAQTVSERGGPVREPGQSVSTQPGQDVAETVPAGTSAQAQSGHAVTFSEDVGGGVSLVSAQALQEGLPLLGSLYDRLLREKEERIDELRAALEHEREMSRRLGEALAREQTLRALPAPDIVREAAASAEKKAEATNNGVGGNSGRVTVRMLLKMPVAGKIANG